MPVHSIESDYKIIKKTYDIWSEVVYKPLDCSIRLTMNFNSIDVLICYTVVCSRTGNKIVQSFYRGFTVWQFRNASTLKETLEILHKFILEIEHHESSEHFKYKGEMIFDPHTTPYNGRF